jgi:hypothetical protein
MAKEEAAAAKSPAPAASPAAQAATASPVEQKKGGHGCLYVILGCGGLLLLCCCISVFVGFFAPNAALKFLAGANSGPDTTLTRIKTSELAQAQTDLDNSLASQTDTNANTITIKISEKDVIVLFFGQLLGSNNIDKVGVKILPGQTKVQFELKALLDAANQQTSQSATGSVVPTTSADQYAAFAGIYSTITLGVSPDGKGFTVTDISTGNTIIDGLIPAAYKQSIEEQLATEMNNGFTTGLSSGASGVILDKIAFTSGYMEITLSQP